MYIIYARCELYSVSTWTAEMNPSSRTTGQN